MSARVFANFFQSIECFKHSGRLAARTIFLNADFSITVKSATTSEFSISVSYPVLVKLLYPVMLRFLVTFLFISSPDSQVCRAENNTAAPAANQARDSNRKFTVTLSKLSNGVTGLTSTIYINAPPERVWKVLTDYNNLKRYIPRMVESDLIADKGALKVIALQGEFRILLFTQTINLTINMHETYPRRIDYEKIAGNFEVYQGYWTFEELPSTKGTHLTYVSELKPAFFAPDIIFLSTLKKDITNGLSALRKEAEALNPEGAPPHPDWSGYRETN
jgi:ribosome-associated toxin RatA of RatAB toxin-antitoxin module